MASLIKTSSDNGPETEFTKDLRLAVLIDADNVPYSNIKGMLEENSIEVVIMNKLDSSYLNFGDIELYVPLHLKEIAQQLLNSALTN